MNKEETLVYAYLLDGKGIPLCINVDTDSSDKRRGLLVISPRFYLIFKAIQDIEVVGLEMKS